MPSSDVVKVGKYRISKQRFWKRIYFLISVGIAFMFVSALIYMILFGRSPG